MSKASVSHEERCMLRDLRSKCNNDEDFFNEVADIIGPLMQDRKNLAVLRETNRILIEEKWEDIMEFAKKQ